MSLSGQRNLPPSNFFAHTQNPLPSYTRSFTRLPEQKHMAAFCFCRVVNQREQQHLGTPAGCSQAPNLQFYCFVHMPGIGRKNGVRKVDLCWFSLLSVLLSDDLFQPFYGRSFQTSFLFSFPFRFLAVMAAAIPLVLLMKPTPEKLRFPVYVSLICLATRAVRIAVVHCNSSAKMYRSNWNAFRRPPGYPISGS
jgi:hypothetical protein